MPQHPPGFLAKMEIPQDAFDAIKRNLLLVDSIAPGQYRGMIRDNGTAIDLTGYVLVVGDLPKRLGLKVPPRELDVPHWARNQVDADRILLDKEAGFQTRDRITDRMIYARLVDIADESLRNGGPPMAEAQARQRIVDLIEETAPDQP